LAATSGGTSSGARKRGAKKRPPFRPTLVRLEDRVTPCGSPPTVLTGAGGPVSASRATVQATINPNGSATSALFQYSTDPSFPLSGGATTIGSGFNKPGAVAVGRAGDVLVADTVNSAVKEVLPDGTIKTIGSGFSRPSGVAVDAGRAGGVREPHAGRGPPLMLGLMFRPDDPARVTPGQRRKRTNPSGR
jgi:hypothetical protein